MNDVMNDLQGGDLVYGTAHEMDSVYYFGGGKVGTNLEVFHSGLTSPTQRLVGSSSLFYRSRECTIMNGRHLSCGVRSSEEGSLPLLASN